MESDSVARTAWPCWHLGTAEGFLAGERFELTKGQSQLPRGLAGLQELQSAWVSVTVPARGCRSPGGGAGGAPLW